MRTQFLEETLGGYLAHLRGQIDGRVRIALEDGPLSDETVRSIVAETLKLARSELAAREDLEWSSREFAEAAVAPGAEPYDKVVSAVFENLPLEDESKVLLVELCRLILYKDLFSGGGSSLIVAGFGSDEAFPAIISFEIDGLYDGVAKVARRSEYRVGVDGSASISPFAQREMVDTFISGIAPDYEQALDGFVSGFMHDLPALIGETIDDPTVRQSIEQAIADVGHRAAQHFAERRRVFTAERFVDPILAAVEVLPKEELAEMAEALVNLTSFKRRVSMGEVETVGGPIDVAVISKVDGLIWIQRKHYFDPSLNPQFFANYYRNDPKEQR